MNASPISRFPVTIDGETTYVGTANELAIVLDVLQGNHDRAVLEQLRPHLADIIASPHGFIATMKSLEPANQILLTQAIGPALARVLQNAANLSTLLATLASAEVKDAVLHTLDTAGLRALVITAHDLATVLHWVYGQSDQAVLECLGSDYVRSIIRTGDDLGRVLGALESDSQNALLDQLGLAHVVEIVRSGRELAYVLRALPPAHSARLLDRYTHADLRALIGNTRDWEYLWARLEPEEQALVTKKLGAK